VEEAGLPVPETPIAPVPVSIFDSILFDLDVSSNPCFATLAASPDSKLSETIVCCCSDSSRLPKRDSTFVCWDEVVRRGCGVGVGGGEGIGAGGLVAAKNENPALASSVD